MMPWMILSSVFALGATAVVTQLVMLREMLCAFTGNELVLGIVLGNWLLLSGCGAWLGRWSNHAKKPRTTLALCLTLVAWLPWEQLFFFRHLHDVIFIHGVTVSVLGTFVSSLALLAPFCLVSGFTLTLASQLLATPENHAGIGRVYAADCAGSVMGGALFSFVFIHFLGHAQTLLLLGAMSLMLAGYVAFQADKRVLVLVGLVLANLALLRPSDSSPGVLLQANSPYGQLSVVKSDNQITFIENGVPMISSHNVDRVEETVHYAMAQRPGAKQVLLIGGGVSGTAREILKYGVAEVTYVELDPLIIAAGKRFLPENLADPRIKVVTTDGRLFVKQAHDKFAVVIVDMPDPSTSQINRFYTAEFFAEVKRVLAPGGVLSFAVGRYENYVSPQLARLLATANATARNAFRNVLLLPGGRVFFVASDGELTADIAGALEQAGVRTQLLRPSYLAALLAPDRRADIQRAIAIPASLNADFSPVLYFQQMRHWLSQFPVKLGLVAGVVGLGLVVYVALLRPVGLVIFASGFAASALEVVVLLGFQILAGSLYRQVGVIVTVFMAGLAVGAWWANRIVGGASPLQRIAVAVAAMATVLPWALRGLGYLPVWAVQVGVALVTFVLAMLVGMEFPVAARIQFDDGATTASRLYTADFVGAWLGALLASTLLIPVLGVAATCWLTAGLNVVAAGLLAWRRR